MRAFKRTRTARKREAGYALLLVMLFTVFVMIAAMTVTLRQDTQGRRQLEGEMIWRGKQYTRGIKLYYRKTGRFPTSLEDLTKPKTGIRFMRQAYKDPMNKEDGSWRLLYVGPAGQIIGSMKQNPRNLQLPAAGSPSQSGTQPGAPSPGAAQNPPGGQPPTGTGQPVGTDQTGTGSSSDTSNPQPITPSQQMGPIIGGNIIGVGSKVNRMSIIVYDRGRRYLEWEFIWDPTKDAIGVGQPGMQVGTPAGREPGAGQNPPMMNPNPNPPQPNPNPPPQ